MSLWLLSVESEIALTSEEKLIPCPGSIYMFKVNSGSTRTMCEANNEDSRTTFLIHE